MIYRYVLRKPKLSIFLFYPIFPTKKYLKKIVLGNVFILIIH